MGDADLTIEADDADLTIEADDAHIHRPVGAYIDALDWQWINGPTIRNYAAALAAAGEREELMLRLGAELGLRRAEIAQVHARDVHDAPDGAWLRVLGKGGKLRHLPLPDDLAELIRERAGRGFLFRGNDRGHLSPRYVGKITSNLLPQGVTLHALRHRFATRAYAVDRDVFAVQQLLGHARADTTQRYVRVPSSALRSTVTAAR